MTLRVVSSSSSGARTGGAVQVVVPDVTGKTEAEAKVLLDDFTVRARLVEDSGTAGTVFGTEPSANSVRPRRSLVTIFLIVNPAPDSAEVTKALAELKKSVETLGTAPLETESDAKTRNDEVLKELKDIKEKLPTSPKTA